MSIYVATYRAASGLFRLRIESIDRSEAYRLAIQRTPAGMCLTNIRAMKA